MTARLPGLDLLRALAIVLVVNCHAASTFAPDGLVKSWLQAGGFGVDLFFVLSGWLLGQQLFAEKRDTGTVDVRRFWLRRWLRTLPAYYAVLAGQYATQLLLHPGEANLDPSFLWFGQTYLLNVAELPLFGVSWSLCVEEHFYLVVAPLVLLLPRRWAVPTFATLLCLPTAFRVIGWHGVQHGQTHVQFDPCVCGVLLAALSVYHPEAWRWLGRWSGAFAAVGTAVLLVHLDRDWAEAVFPWGWGKLLLGLAFGSWVLFAVGGTRASRLLDVPGAKFVATRAYALYLLHPEALAVTVRLVKYLPGVPFVVPLLLTWVLSFAAAELLYRLIEKPAMNLRERFTATRTLPKPTAAVAPAAPIPNQV